MKESLSRPPVQVRALDLAKRILGTFTPEGRYTIKILETRAKAALARQAQKRRRILDPKAPQKEEMKDLIRDLDREFSRYIRARDTRPGLDGVRRGHCVTCGTLHTYAEFDCGHWIPRKKAGKFATRWHEFNAHAQCTGCNKWMHGREKEHEAAIRRLHGQHVPDRLRFIHKAGPEPRREAMEKMLEEYKIKADELGAPK